MTKGETRAFYDSMDEQTYITAMGGTVEADANVSTNAKVHTGINPTNANVWKYFGLLRNMAMNRYMWHSDILGEAEVRLIEWHIFHSGQATLLRPRFSQRGKPTVELTTPRVYLTNVTRRNLRTFEPITVNLVTNNTDTTEKLGLMLEQEYGLGQFVLITNQFNQSLSNMSDSYFAWEYANKLHELDLLFNANTTKGRLPLLFNNGAKKDKNNQKLFTKIGVGIADIINSALTSNRQFVEIPEDKVGDKGLLHQTNQYVDFKGAEIVQLQQVIINQYLESIGIANPKEQRGVYLNENVQNLSTESTFYKTYVGLRNREVFMHQANKLFGLDLKVTAWDTHDITAQRNFEMAHSENQAVAPPTLEV